MYRVTERLINFYEAVMQAEWFRLESGQADEVWQDQRAGFLSRVVGPHFESVCRAYALGAGPDLFGGPIGEVGSGVVNDPANRSQIEIDVVVFAPTEPGRPRRILSLGEAKWGQAMGMQHVERLGRARDLLSANYDTTDCLFACYAAAGFHGDLCASEDPRLVLVTLEDLYRAPSGRMPV